MKKLYCGVLAFLLINLFTNAQQVRFGIKGGFNLADVALKYKGITNYDGTKVRFAPNASLFVDININEFLSIQPNLMVTGKGFKMKDNSDKNISIFDANFADSTVLYDFLFSTTYSKFSPLYIEVPIYAMVRLPLGEVKVFFGLGPYFAYGIQGKSKKIGYKDEFDIWKGGGKNLIFKNFDAGASLTAGIEIKRIILGVQYDYGMVNYLDKNVSFPSLDTKIGQLTEQKIYGDHDFFKNRVFTFNLGFVIIGGNEKKNKTRRSKKI